VAGWPGWCTHNPVFANRFQAAESAAQVEATVPSSTLERQAAKHHIWGIAVENPKESPQQCYLSAYYHQNALVDVQFAEEFECTGLGADWRS
jgi:hypothetical protein